MKLKFNKWLFSLIAIIFGFSGTVAAQYGIVEYHYNIKGNVTSEKCKNTIPKIKVKIKTTNSYGVGINDSAYTDEQGNFNLTLLTSMMSSYNNFELVAEDIDGKANKGEFQDFSQPVIFNKEDFAITRKEEWDQYFDSKTTYYIGMKFKEDEPCK